MSFVFNRHVGNILTVYAYADRLDKKAGMDAYAEYLRIMLNLAREFDFTTDEVCGVFAALSPNADYKTNLSSTKTMLGAFNNGRSLDEFRVTTYGNNKRKAWSILNGKTPLEVLLAKKTRSFYLNISNPHDPDPVTIDGHMYSVWWLERFKMQDAQVGSGNRYDKIAADYRFAAKALGILPNQLQAICWFARKRLNLISVDRESLQLPMFSVPDALQIQA